MPSSRSSPRPSSVIRRFDYDASRRRLRVTFTSGDVYDYDALPPEVAEGLRSAPSEGRFFGPKIRDSYAYRRVARGEGRA